MCYRSGVPNGGQVIGQVTITRTPVLHEECPARDTHAEFVSESELTRGCCKLRAEATESGEASRSDG